MSDLTRSLRVAINDRARPSLWALRRRGDASALSAVLRGALSMPHRAGDNRDHLRATMGWLCAAQDATADGGVSALYDVRSGEWGPSYPETTGYIIPTFFDYAAYSNDDRYRQRAVCMADWLLTLQLESGAFPIGPLWPDWERTPIVFDTGQIIHGLVRAFEETSCAHYLESARRAGDWLADIQEADGSWLKFTSLEHVHTYNVRAAWSLIRLHETTQNERHLTAAVANLEWALIQQTPEGWFRNAAFRPEEDPLTHTIAYTIEGILESGISLKNERYITAARLAADALGGRQDQDGFLRARYGPGWRSSLGWSCLTGTAQMALIWIRLFELTGNSAYLTSARTAHLYIKQTQDLRSKRAGVAGGVSGSHPIYGDYEPFRHLNWAAKFFADSLLLEERMVAKAPN